MRIKWSWILVIAMGGFIAMIVSMGVVMMRSDSELYERDYYQQGEDYAQRMEEERLGNAIQFRYDRAHHHIEVEHPSGSLLLQELRLIRLSNAEEDFSIRVDGVSGSRIRVPIKELSGTDWIMELRGTLDGEPFFMKEPL